MAIEKRQIAVIGLGYVGLPVAVAFGMKGPIIGFDIDLKRITDLKNGIDATQEISHAALAQSQVGFTHEKKDLIPADFYIICVPTPSDGAHKPDLSALFNACEIVGPCLKKNDIVVFESTVYPGATQEECIPALEKSSQLKASVDFSVGYSPERINPGDKNHSISQIVKVVSALDAKTLEIIAKVYSSIISAGIYKAPNIKVAEACKVLENTQRDLNIALMNELALICDRLNIDTHEVIKAAETKWNFMPFVPGLVGGHCIGIDPYHLSYKAKKLGYRPEVILAGRRINDNMGKYIAEQTVKQMIHLGSKVKGSKVAILGLTFKENCRDIRNTRVMDVINELQSYGVELIVHDPIADKEDALKAYDLNLEIWEEIFDVDAMVLCVAHDYYRQLKPQAFAEKFDNTRLMMDVKGILNKKLFGEVNIRVWQL